MNANYSKTDFKSKEDPYKQGLNSRVKVCIGSSNNLNTITSPVRQEMNMKKPKILSPKMTDKRSAV